MGVLVISTAYSMTSLSRSEKDLPISNRDSSRNCSSLTPDALPTAEPMSIQTGHPTIIAALIPAKAFRRASTSLARSSQYS